MDHPRPNGVYIVQMSSRSDNTLSWKCRVPYYLGGDADTGGKINTVRKAAQARRDEMLTFQKECGSRRDAEGAKFFKLEAADALKEYRAACLLLPLFMCEPPKDCPYREEYEWPIELASWVDRVIDSAL